MVMIINNYVTVCVFTILLLLFYSIKQPIKENLLENNVTPAAASHISCLHFLIVSFLLIGSHVLLYSKMLYRLIAEEK